MERERRKRATSGEEIYINNTGRIIKPSEKKG
jgi:hypothetical protein